MLFRSSWTRRRGRVTGVLCAVCGLGWRQGRAEATGGAIRLGGGGSGRSKADRHLSPTGGTFSFSFSKSFYDCAYRLYLLYKQYISYVHATINMKWIYILCGYMSTRDLCTSNGHRIGSPRIARRKPNHPPTHPPTHTHTHTRVVAAQRRIDEEIKKKSGRRETEMGKRARAGGGGRSCRTEYTAYSPCTAEYLQYCNVWDVFRT